jgi:FkbM family methyltransferase
MEPDTRERGVAVRDFRGYRQGTWLGRLIRLPFKVIPAWLPMPFMHASLRGRWWIAGSGNKSYWLGLYEVETRRCIEERVERGDVVFDIGAHHGLYTLLASKLVGRTGMVVAFEPLPANVTVLEKHIRMNHIGNARVLRAAASDTSGTEPFSTRLSHWEGNLSPDGDVEVRTVAIDDIVGDEVAPPNVIKIDVEGSEVRVLRGARRTLLKHRPVVVLEAHTDALRAECAQLLASLDYETSVLAAPMEGRSASFHMLATPRDKGRPPAAVRPPAWPERRPERRGR